MTVLSIDKSAIILERSGRRRIPVSPGRHGLVNSGIAGYGINYFIAGIRRDRGLLHLELFQGGLFHHHFFGGRQPVIGIVRDSGLQGPQQGITGKQYAGFEQFEVKNRFAAFH